MLGSISASVPATRAVPAQSSHVPVPVARAAPVKVFSLLFEDGELFESPELVD